ncbi:electron transport protein [Aeribacillus composti]|uniref:electron transport protein n=1 Tax=Aeribacillus composti TaxID=1868734 RepID=UPI003D1F38C0
MTFKKWFMAVLLVLLCIGMFSFFTVDFRYGYKPKNEKVMPYVPNKFSGFDLWGKQIASEKSTNLIKTEDKTELSPKNGAVTINHHLLKIGRDTFYEETFGNEVFLTDIMGIIDGSFTIGNIAKAIMALKGEGTTNLRVELADDITIGGKRYKKGEKIDTGIDVVKGTYVPLGMPVTFSKGKIRVGISCAACHATVDQNTKQVIEGAPNNDLNLGLLLALATNSSAYFTHGNIASIKDYLKGTDRSVTTTKGTKEALPDPESLEKAVDETFQKWPRGHFDSSIDLISNPTDIPDSFTLGDHPYGWSGFAAAGSFRGLSAFSNNVHAQNADTLSQSEISKDLFGIDKEVYLGTILQNAANPNFRYNPKSGIKPSKFFQTVDPTPDVPGINQLVAPPQFPKVSLTAPDGLIVSSPGYKFNEQNNGVAAWQNTLQPPKPNMKIERAAIEQGKKVFAKANCITCHAGSTLTNNQVISVKEIGTEPSRAKALKKYGKVMGESLLYSPETPVPLPKKPTVLKVPTEHLNRDQLKLAFALGDSPGGYKVPSLIGLYWTAPYLHDGSVAVGNDIDQEIGVTGTILKGITPDPANSLRALVDKSLRDKVIKANLTSQQLQDLHIKGIGHEYWVDESTGFTKSEQDALIKYLLSLTAIQKNK